MDGLELELTDGSDPRSLWVIREFFEEMNREFAAGFDVDDALATAPLTLSAPHGLYVLLLVAGECVGGGGLNWVDAHRAEVKRVWVEPRHRGAGLSTVLMSDLEHRARAAGRSEVVLDTNGVLVQALAVYAHLGYEPTERYNDNPYATHWFRKSLVG